MTALLAATAVVAGCGSAAKLAARSTIPGWLLAQARTIGAGAQFQPPARGPVLGPCRPQLGARIEAHVELFAENHVVLVASGIGTHPPRVMSAGRIVGARCYGALVTLDPTGVVLVRGGPPLTVADLFRSWGEPLAQARLAGFAAPRGTQVTVFVDGRAWRGAPGSVPLTAHAEIVLEVGPHVPPHRGYTFPPLP